MHDFYAIGLLVVQSLGHLQRRPYTHALGVSGSVWNTRCISLRMARDEVFSYDFDQKWPVQFIALFYFGFEIYKAWQVYGLSQVSHVAHIAHFGGFILAYATLPILKRNIEWEGEIEIGEITAENPFEGVDDLVKRLHEEGDEKETSSLKRKSQIGQNVQLARKATSEKNAHPM